MGYRSAFLGCGPRAVGHVKAYAHITRGEVVACCDLHAERREAFASTFGVPAQYADLDEMLRQEQPDVVHMVTPPTLRVELMTRLAEAGVPGVIVEKPICIGAQDYQALGRLEAESDTRFVVNHQLRHHPKITELLEDVHSGAIGTVRNLDASARLPMAGQGVHVLNLLFAFAGTRAVETVFATASGYDDINGTHPTAKSMAALLTFKDGRRATLHAGEGAPPVDQDPTVWRHKRIAVYGTHGFRHWWMNGWEASRADRTVERGTFTYSDVDVLGQAGLTNALFDWLEDEDKPSPTCLATALDEWAVILAAYVSVAEGRPVEMPCVYPDDLLERFVDYVSATPRVCAPVEV